MLRKTPQVVDFGTAFGPVAFQKPFFGTARRGAFVNFFVPISYPFLALFSVPGRRFWFQFWIHFWFRKLGPKARPLIVFIIKAFKAGFVLGAENGSRIGARNCIAGFRFRPFFISESDQTWVRESGFGGLVNLAGFCCLAVVELRCLPGAARNGRPPNQHGRDVHMSVARRWEGGGAMQQDAPEAMER